MIIKFDKSFKNEKYEILFNTESGFEITRGINGNADPFVLELPSLLDIGVMGTCIHKCPFCYQGHVNRPNMKLSDFKSIIDQTSHHVNQVALGGRGDPNNHKNFKEIVEYCRENNVVPNYTTSGIGLTDEQIEISKMCGAVAVSDYAQDYTYEALQKFIDAGIKTNIHQIFSSTSFSRCMNIVLGYIPADWKFDYEKLNAVIFLLFKPHGAGKDTPELIPNVASISTFATHAFDPKSKFKIGMDSCLINHILKYGRPTKLQKMTIDTCEAARMSAYITPDMKFMPCSFADETKWAVPLNNNLYKVWNEETPFIKFRKMLSRNHDKCPLGL
jgi:hypothetical protein